MLKSIKFKIDPNAYNDGRVAALRAQFQASEDKKGSKNLEAQARAIERGFDFDPNHEKLVEEIEFLTGPISV